MKLRVKYHRIKHLPWSLGATKDDSILEHVNFRDDIVMTLKMDGECTTLYRDGLHARSTTYKAHPSRDWIRAKHAKIAYKIPLNMRVVGENLWAKHSIHYTDLTSFFQVFSVWIGDKCEDWKTTVQVAHDLGFPTVPVLWEGEYNRRLLDSEFKPHAEKHEGYVVRVWSGYNLDELDGTFTTIAKYVRQGHVQTNDHWLRQQVVKNSLEKPND